MAKVDWKQTLHNIKALKCLNEKEFGSLLAHSDPLIFKQNEIVLNEGDTDKDLYIVGSGAVMITLDGTGGREIPIDTLRTGAFFGEMAQIEKKPRVASVIASEDCELLKVNGAFFEELLEQNIQLKSNIMLILSERMRKIIEHVLAVKLRSFDEKFELSNTRMNANLKAVETQLQAAHTVFDQTTTRANEIIESSERSRKWVYGIVGLLPVVIAMFGIFGLDKISGVSELREDIDERLKDKIEELDQFGTDINVLKKEIEDANEMAEEVSESRKNMAKIESLVIFDTIQYHFRDNVQRRPKFALEVFAETLKNDNTAMVETIFKQIESGIVRAKDREKFVRLLNSALSQDLTKNAKQTGLSHYYLLAAALLDNDKDAYNKQLAAFNQFVDSNKESITFANDFRPEAFQFVMRKNGDDQASTQIDQAWRRLIQG
jgi:CRP-like cAMP-binding protein